MGRGALQQTQADAVHEPHQEDHQDQLGDGEDDPIRLRGRWDEPPGPARADHPTQDRDRLDDDLNDEVVGLTPGPPGQATKDNAKDPRDQKRKQPPTDQGQQGRQER